MVHYSGHVSGCSKSFNLSSFLYSPSLLFSLPLYDSTLVVVLGEWIAVAVKLQFSSKLFTQSTPYLMKLCGGRSVSRDERKLPATTTNLSQELIWWRYNKEPGPREDQETEWWENLFFGSNRWINGELLFFWFLLTMAKSVDWISTSVVLVVVCQSISKTNTETQLAKDETWYLLAI